MKKAIGLNLSKEIKLRTKRSKALCAYVVQFPGLSDSVLEKDPKIESILNEILDSVTKEAGKGLKDEQALSLAAMEAFHTWYFSRKQ